MSNDKKSNTQQANGYLASATAHRAQTSLD